MGIRTDAAARAHRLTHFSGFFRAAIRTSDRAARTIKRMEVFMRTGFAMLLLTVAVPAGAQP